MIKTAIATAAIVFAGSALAGERFTYSSADFASPEAVRALHQRIEHDARSYCTREYLESKHLSQIRQCTQAVTSEIIDGIGDQRLFAVAAEATQGAS
jgi:UrcA family protein